MLASTSLSEQSAPVATAQTLNTVGATQSLDQLQTQVKALRQRATNTQNAIEQLTALQDAGRVHNGLLSDDPWTMGAEVLVLGLGALLIGWLLGLLTTRRRVLAAPAPVPTPAQNRLADRQMTLREAEPVATPPVLDTRREPPDDPIPDHASAPLPSVFNHMDFEQSALLLDSASVLGLFEDVVHPPGSQTTSRSSPLQAGVDARQPVVVHGFDSAAAANEVERVRKSLALKRDARARQRAYEVSVHSALQPDSSSDGVDLLLDLPDECAGESNLFVPDACVADWEAPAIAESEALTFELPAELDSSIAGEPLTAPDAPLTLAPIDPPGEFEPEPEPEPLPDVVSEAMAEEVTGPETQPDAVVQLELALEFEALRLLDGAREIAQEVLESSDDELRLKAEALMARLHAIETAQHADALVADAHS